MMNPKTDPSNERLCLLSRRAIFVCLTIILNLSFAAAGYSTPVVSMEIVGSASPAVGEQLKVNVNITKGEGVGGYSTALAFDATALKYIGAANGDYLPKPQIWIAPVLTDDGSYKLEFKLGDSTSVGETVQFGPDQEISVDDMFFNISERQPDDASSRFSGQNYWAITPLASSAPQVAPAGDGTLITFTFEVLEVKPSTIDVVNVHLSGADDGPLGYALETDSVTIHADSTPTTDVNGDGTVNILDLVFVAAQFGKPLTAANQAADINSDGTVNILDLVAIARDFGG